MTNKLYTITREIYYRFPLPFYVKKRMKNAVFFVIALLKKRQNHEVKNELSDDIVSRSRTLTRKDKMLRYIIPSDQDGLEIGPLCWPIVTKQESFGRIYYVDFSTAEKSREKYKNDPNVNIDDIVETDYLWGNRTLPELVNGKLFDYVIASHVIEHVPNMLGWMREIASVLVDGGTLSLAIPDKRYTFDYKRQLTSLGKLVQAYLMDKRRPSIEDIFDQVSLATKVDMVKAWSGTMDPATLEHHGTLDEALNQAREYLSSDEYNDVHVNILTPERFLTILEQASQIGLFDFIVADFYDTEYNSHEFFVSLQRISRNSPDQKSLEIQRESILESKNRLSTTN